MSWTPANDFNLDSLHRLPYRHASLAEKAYSLSHCHCFSHVQFKRLKVKFARSSDRMEDTVTYSINSHVEDTTEFQLIVFRLLVINMYRHDFLLQNHLHGQSLTAVTLSTPTSREDLVPRDRTAWRYYVQSGYWTTQSPFGRVPRDRGL